QKLVKVRAKPKLRDFAANIRGECVAVGPGQAETDRTRSPNSCARKLTQTPADAAFVWWRRVRHRVNHRFLISLPSVNNQGCRPEYRCKLRRTDRATKLAEKESDVVVTN